MKHIVIIVGARPNFMKVAPLLRLLKKHTSFKVTLIHTGQHYDKKMSDVFFDDLNIPKPDYNLNVRSGSHAEQTAKIMVSFEKICIDIKPNLLMVVGDVNSTMACSIVAKKLHIEVAHIEAGLRSNDRKMPEEINRLITDSITDYFFVTEDSGKTNLLNEGQKKSSIFFVGNLMIDSLHYGLDKIKNKSRFEKEEYGLVTLHRPSNVDDINNLTKILEALSDISNQIKLLFSIHPRTQNVINNNNITLNKNIKVLDALPYLEFLRLMRDSKVIFTDSGGIQEESTILKVPCYTLRNNTERPITITQGTNYLVGNKKTNILKSFKENQFSINTNYQIPYGWDGRTSNRILEILDQII